AHVRGSGGGREKILEPALAGILSRTSRKRASVLNRRMPAGFASPGRPPSSGSAPGCLRAVAASGAAARRAAGRCTAGGGCATKVMRAAQEGCSCARLRRGARKDSRTRGQRGRRRGILAPAGGRAGGAGRYARDAGGFNRG